MRVPFFLSLLKTTQNFDQCFGTPSTASATPVMHSSSLPLMSSSSTTSSSSSFWVFPTRRARVGLQVPVFVTRRRERMVYGGVRNKRGVVERINKYRISTRVVEACGGGGVRVVTVGKEEEKMKKRERAKRRRRGGAVSGKKGYRGWLASGGACAPHTPGRHAGEGRR